MAGRARFRVAAMFPTSMSLRLEPAACITLVSLVAHAHTHVSSGNTLFLAFLSVFGNNCKYIILRATFHISKCSFSGFVFYCSCDPQAFQMFFSNQGIALDSSLLGSYRPKLTKVSS